jgi:hypothetical protein
MMPFDGTPIDALELNARAYACLHNDCIDTVEQLRTISDAELLRIPNFGRKSLEEVKKCIARWERLDKAPVVPPVLPQPDPHLQVLKGIEQHLAIISGLLMRSKSDQLLFQLSAMVQYLFEQETGLNPTRLFEGGKPLNVR